MKHKHCDIIKAWADGAQIQYKSGSCWKDTCEPRWAASMEYRVKPVTIKFRNYLARHFGQHAVFHMKTTSPTSLASESDYERCSDFIRWVGDWQEVEV